MNKSILRHEVRSIKESFLLNIVISILLVLVFNNMMVESFEHMLNTGLNVFTFEVQDNIFRLLSGLMVSYSVLSILQIFMQFRQEEKSSTKRFLKSLPVSSKEFITSKLVVGLLNLAIGFILVTVGILIVRSKNMYWIENIYEVSPVASYIIKADSVMGTLKILGLTYLVIFSFYTFLFMIQYAVTNVFGGIIIGGLVYLAPMFIAMNLAVFLEFVLNLEYNQPIMEALRTGIVFLPFFYPFNMNDIQFINSSMGVHHNSMISLEGIGFKSLILIVMVILNIFIAYKLSEKNRVENEDKLIPLKICKAIFIFGVSLCSAFVVALLLSLVLFVEVNRFVYLLGFILGGIIGFLISKRIGKIGER